MSNKPFKILSIDGGGTRGVFPARFLCEMEDELERAGKDPRLMHYFDLICGTSTGAIIALGLALGMPGSLILRLYLDHAKKIFRKPCWRLGILQPKYSSAYLTSLLRREFSRYAPDGDTRLGHCKTRVCVPTFELNEGRVRVFKTSHHEGLIRDYQIPAHHVAISSASAPVFFPPYSFTYRNKGSENTINVRCTVDGGVIANNPTYIGIVEAHHALGVPLSALRVLSLGTGHSVMRGDEPSTGYGFLYWGNTKVRLVDLMFSAQAQTTDNLIKFMHTGLGNEGQETFYYKRIQHQFPNDWQPAMDETRPKELEKLETLGIDHYQKNGAEVYRMFLTEIKDEFIPLKNL